MAMGYWLSYAVPTSFSLDANTAITSILAQVPFDAIGILGIAVFTLLIYNAQVDRLSLALFASVLLAFIAVIFDLAQLLAQGSSNASNSTSESQVQGLIAIRETTFALSLSLRYTWFSAFIVRSVQQTQPQPVITTSSSGPEPLSWKRLGVLGILLKWGLLIMIATIFGLQIAWRLVDGPSTRAAFLTSAAIEVGIIAVFVGKLGFNFVFVKEAQRWRLFRTYVIPILALVFQFSVAFGNLFYFPFSETVLGRFFAAVGLYLLILWTMEDGFTRQTAPTPRIPNEPPILPVALRRGSTLRLSIPSINQTRSLSPVPDLPQAQEKRVRRSRPSIASRSSITSWITNRRILRAQVPYDNDDQRLWVQDQEQGFSPVVNNEEKIARLSNRISEEQRPVTEAQNEAEWLDPMFSALSASPEQVDDVRTAQPFSPPVLNTPSGPDLLHEDHEFNPEPTPVSPSPFARAESPLVQWKIKVQGPASAPNTPQIGSSLIAPTFSETDRATSGHGVEQDQDEILLPPRSFLAPSLDSPVYGLEGMRESDPEQLGSRPPNFLHMSTASSIARSSLTSHTDIEEVLRRQQVLDRSIERLKLTTTSRSSSVIMEPTSRRSMISSISGVSLAQFPAPPWVKRPLIPGSSRPSSRLSLSTTGAPVRASRRRSASLNSIDFRPPQMPAAIADDRAAAHVSLPESLRDDTDMLVSPRRSPKFESKGTEYVITSFIGGLSSVQSTGTTRLSVDRSAGSTANPPQASSIRYIKAEDLPMGSGEERAVRVRTRTTSQDTTRAPIATGLRGPRPRGSSMVKGSLSNLNKEMISGPRPLRPLSTTQFSEQPRKAPAVPSAQS